MYGSEDIHPMLKVTFGSLYERTLAIENKFKDKGYLVVTKWEH